jgi:hypothetical protein
VHASLLALAASALVAVRDGIIRLTGSLPFTDPDENLMDSTADVLPTAISARMPST